MRREKTITIEADNRDKDKSFTIREMGALTADRWVCRAMFVLTRPTPHWADIQPLLDDILDCIAEPLSEIEEVSTLIQLRKEVLNLHLELSMRERIAAFIESESSP